MSSLGRDLPEPVNFLRLCLQHLMLCLPYWGSAVIAEEVNTFLGKVFIECKEWGKDSISGSVSMETTFEGAWKNQAPARSARKKLLAWGKPQIPQGWGLFWGYCQHQKAWQVAEEHLAMWLTLNVLAFVNNRSAGRTPSHTTPKFRDETICSLRHLCFCIQQTFIENIPCARDWMKLSPCLQDLIV